MSRKDQTQKKKTLSSTKGVSTVPIESMTGFSRVTGENDEASWTWELKSLNAKGLDVRVRLPEMLARFELPVSNTLRQHLSRGSVTANLMLTQSDALTSLRLNREMLYEILRIKDELRGMIVEEPMTLEGVLKAKDLILTEMDDSSIEALWPALEASLKEAVKSLCAQRQQEGLVLCDIVGEHLTAIGELASQAEKQAADQPRVIQERLEKFVAEFLAKQGDLEPQRLAQEIALQAGKADVREELDRLKAHVVQTEEALLSGGVIGRRLDFMAQELHREANTLCAKATTTDLKKIGLDLKIRVEQFREQLQNIA